MVMTSSASHQAEPTTLTDAVRKHIRELRKQGYTRDQIADELHIAKSSVWHAYSSYSLSEVATMESAMRQVRDALMTRIRGTLASGIAPNPITDQDFELVEVLNNALGE